MTIQRKIAAAARSTPNRGKIHLFLGDPLSDAADKTTVEPGNTYSPGIWSCGVSLWIDHKDTLTTPDQLPDDAVTWGFEPGIRQGVTPIINSSYQTATGLCVTHRLCHIGGTGCEGADFNEVRVVSPQDTSATLAIVVKDQGPAGGRITDLKWEQSTRILTISKGTILIVENESAVCEIIPVEGVFDSPVAIISMSLVLKKNRPVLITFKTCHRNWGLGWETIMTRRHENTSVSDAIASAATAWKSTLPARVFAPDPRVASAWEQCGIHILNAMERGLPRIGAVNYPVFWIRDCVIVLRALDLMGRSDLARIGCNYLSPLCFGGGFGAEADAPGEGIWAIVNHAIMTRDTAWLKTVFPHIIARAGWIEHMLDTKEPLHALAENRMPAMQNNPDSTLVCLPPLNGTVHGRMDNHFPDFYVNSWAFAGLSMAQRAARMLGDTTLAGAWGARASALETAIAANLLPTYGNDRDPAVAPYPTGACGSDTDKLRRHFMSFMNKHRLTPDGGRIPEPLWTYFEAATIHNALRLGLIDEAWTCLDGMLNPAVPWDMTLYTEGNPGENEFLPFKNGEARRGWLGANALAGNMPHNWTSAEMMNLIRTVFVHEEDGKIILGKGVPKEWIKPGAQFGVTDMPTELGTVSYTATINAHSEIILEYQGPREYELAERLNVRKESRNEK